MNAAVDCRGREEAHLTQAEYQFTLHPGVGHPPAHGAHLARRPPVKVASNSRLRCHGPIGVKSHGQSNSGSDNPNSDGGQNSLCAVRIVSRLTRTLCHRPGDCAFAFFAAAPFRCVALNALARPARPPCPSSSKNLSSFDGEIILAFAQRSASAHLLLIFSGVRGDEQSMMIRIGCESLRKVMP
jgi:hypothetical protein